MSAELVLTDRAALAQSAARRLTEEVKADAQTLWEKCLRLYEGEAHRSLGYDSWGEYWQAEFGGGKSHAYRLLDAARAIRLLPDSPMGERPNERQARELAPLKDEPEKLAEAWEEASGDGEPTAAKVKEAVGKRMGVHYSSARDDWETPQDLFDELDMEFGFDLDVCALESSAKCESYFTPEDDGLAQEWTGTCWMNPPYGDAIGAWVKKARESAETGATVVCLLPARVDTAWWWDNCRAGEIRFLRGRLKFGGGTTGAPFPSAVVIFGDDFAPRVRWWER